MIILRSSNDDDTAELEMLFLRTQKAAFLWEDLSSFKIGDFKKSTKGESVWVAEKDNVLIGFVSIWFDPKVNFIHNLFILPEFQQQGVGKSLLSKALDIASSTDIVELKVAVKNKDAIQFYENQGWERINIRNDCGPEPYYVMQFRYQ